MSDLSIVKDVLIILTISIPIVFIFQKIKIPSIVGFLIAGILVGPHGLRLITDDAAIQMLANFGVILLLFTIGVELSIQQFLQMKRTLLIAGSFQVVVTILIFTLASYLLGLPLNQSLFLGMLGSHSSTAVILKILSDKNEVDSLHGRITTGMTVFQDLASVPMILLLPVLSATTVEITPTEIILQLLLSFGAVAAVVVLARFLMPRIVYYLASVRIREAFTIGILTLILGTAYVTSMAGLSLALGAFITGLVLSESEFNRQVFADVIPLRDAFNSIFFVSIGLLLDTGLVFENIFFFLLIVCGIVAVKSVVVIVIIMAMKFPFKIALLTGLGLAQIGEFAFVLAVVGMDYEIISPELHSGFLASSIATMLLIPLLMQIVPPFFDRIFSNVFRKPAELTPPVLTSVRHHVIIVGYGLNGQNLSRVLRETGIPYLIVDMNPDIVRKLRDKGEYVIFGDVCKTEILEQASVETAQCIVFAMADHQSTRLGLILARRMNPSIYSVIRLRNLREIDDFILLGANEIIPEEFETSLHIFSKVLESYHIPLNIILKQISIVRAESYRMLRKEGMVTSQFARLGEILAAGITETYYVEDGNPHIGTTLAAVNLRARTGATIIAVVRNGKAIPNPSPGETVTAHDTYVVVGDHKSVDRAIQVLNGET